MLMVLLLILSNEIIRSGSYATVLTKNNSRTVCKGSLVQKGLYKYFQPMSKFMSTLTGLIYYYRSEIITKSC